MNRMAALGDASLVVTIAMIFQAHGPSARHWLTRGQALIVGVVAAACLVAVLGVSGSYGSRRRHRMAPAAFDVVVGVGVAAIADRLLVWAFAPQVLHAGVWLLVWTSSVVLALLTARAAAIVVARRVGGAGWLRRRVAVVGEAPTGAPLVSALSEDPQYELLGRFADDDSGARDLGALRRLAEDEGVDLIVIAAPWSSPGNPFALAGRLQWISADVFALVDEPETLRGSRALTEVAGRSALVLHRHPLKGTMAVVKLLQDYVVATTAVIFISPLLLLVAITLKVAGGGPVLFRQSRLGFNGRPFTIYKFRTMRFDPADDGSRGAVKDDPRCTRIGAFLRKTSLDELPQIFNVLRGEMSIVGPRPHVPNMQVGDGAYAEVVRAYAARHQIKPGVTGWAQINGMRGGIHSVDKAREGVELDLYYIRNWSLWLDLRIILATALNHLTGPSVF